MYSRASRPDTQTSYNFLNLAIGTDEDTADNKSTAVHQCMRHHDGLCLLQKEPTSAVHTVADTDICMLLLVDMVCSCCMSPTQECAETCDTATLKKSKSKSPLVMVADTTQDDW